LENQLSTNFPTIHISSKSSKDHTGILFSTIRRHNPSETCYFKKNGQVKIAFFREKWWKIDIRNDFSMILTTDSERADSKTLRYVFFINILQHFHRKFLSGNQRKILVTSGINGLNTLKSSIFIKCSVMDKKGKTKLENRRELIEREKDLINCYEAKKPNLNISTSWKKLS